jgi:hypothetical protein
MATKYTKLIKRSNNRLDEICRPYYYTFDNNIIQQILDNQGKYLLKYTEFIGLQKKSFKIPKGKSESVNRRTTDNTMAKRKSTKGETSTKHTHKTKDRVTRTPLTPGGELRCSGRVQEKLEIQCNMIRIY